MNTLKIDTERIGDWKNCITISNGEAELLLTTDVGPRILRYRLVGGRNRLYEFEETLGKVGVEEFKPYGGHRLWHSPQDGNRCSEPDNEKIEYEVTGNTVILKQSVEPIARIEKQMEITLAPKGTEVSILHRMINKNIWPVELAAWGLTALAGGGLEIMPWTDRRPPDYFPHTAVAFWPWSKPNDPRFSFGDKYMTLNQEAGNSNWFKIGYPNTAGWAAYVLDEQMYVKKHCHLPGEKYPDYDSSFATYTDDRVMEMESLSPLKMLDPGESLEHEEKWYLCNNVCRPETQDDIDTNILPLIRKLV